MHVLSTPPAFVLSQDQTLQQKLVEKLSRQQKCCQRNPNQPNRSLTSPGYKTIGTGFSSTLLSSQRTTTHHPASHSRRTRPGQSIPSHTRRSRAGHFYYVTSPSSPCQPECPGLPRFVRVGADEHAQRCTASLIIGFGRPAARGLPLARPVPCRSTTLPGRSRLTKSALRRIRGTARTGSDR